MTDMTLFDILCKTGPIFLEVNGKIRSIAISPTFFDPMNFKPRKYLLIDNVRVAHVNLESLYDKEIIK